MHTLDRVAAARHLCQEACMCLTSLRGGPPHVARGDLAQDLMDLRDRIASEVNDNDDYTTTKTSSSSETPESSEVEASKQGSNVPPNARTSEETLGDPYARPFLQVVIDPRASGPHTLVALRAIYRMLEQGSLQHYQVPLEELTQGVLSCKFEQTDPGADEAVEMAISDVLCMLVQIDTQQEQPTTTDATTTTSATTNRMSSDVLMDAFNTVFITRNTFVSSPSLCYHFEDVLTAMVTCVFRHSFTTSAALVLDFLVNQLLHTPLVGGDGLDESAREAQITHDATRVLCLRLVRTALQVGWSSNTTHTDMATSSGDRSVLQIVQDDLCLSLLMTGQAVWAYHDAHTNISPGFVSLEVLSEICATISLLWNTLSLRQHLVKQFETIFTGFYTRALVLLRKRRQPTDSVSFNANLIFDAEVEIILESLVDILCLHDHGRSIADNGDGGSLEILFAFYDCHMQRSDVAMGLMVELCRCCGGTVDEEGEAALTPSTSGIFPGPTPNPTPASSERGTDAYQEPLGQQHSEQPWRHVPAHLKELCAQAIMGSMNCLFCDDHASAETMLERSKRKRSILLRQVADPTEISSEDNNDETGHLLRNLKSKKRLMRKAARIFNKKPSRAISFLVDAGLVPDPVTPASVAAFLRNGIVVGLDKKAVGAYLGEAGKAPVAGNSPLDWERDWFHKEALQIYCSLFRFEQQSLLDGLRMFLATFRLPGEAQQIDRILQAFSDSCGQVCEESCSGRLKLFSEDPKRASDAAYLLSFSIIMLNTDQHNGNIRQDRKMSCDDFVKNNTDYGRDITEKGKELPREYLEGIYESIREEEIRTEGEGAEGAMTVERWKDVMRCLTEDTPQDFHPSQHDVEDLTELVLEHVWRPIVSAIGALWGATFSRYTEAGEPTDPSESAKSGMLGAQGARLGMDMSLDLMNGVRRLGRIDIFRKIFSCVCDYTGLVGEYTENGVERMWILTNSVEAQSAVVAAFRIAAEAGEDLDEDGWRLIWSILFELRDLKLLARGKPGNSTSAFHETDADLLTEGARRDWNICLIKGDMEFDASASPKKGKGTGVGSMLGVFGRALFGPGENMYVDEVNASDGQVVNSKERSVHGKEELVVWDEGAPSDDEAETVETSDNTETVIRRSAGVEFENQLIRESMDMSRQLEMPVTGLERVEETRRYQISPRARVRNRFGKTCSIESLVSDSRFMDEGGIKSLLKSLVAMVSRSSLTISRNMDSIPALPEHRDGIERSISDASSTTSSFVAIHWQVPLSPASEAFAEVLICEIALKNKDRFELLWTDVLQDHYLSRLTSILVNPTEGSMSTKIPVDPGLEKLVSGLIRLSIYAIQRNDIANEVVSSWKYFLPMNAEQHATSPLRALDKHMGEGLWRIVARVDDLFNLKEDGWEGLVSLFNWCATRGAALKPIRSHGHNKVSAIPEDDVAIQCYRSLHLIITTKELEDKVPCAVTESLRILVSAGERRNYSQLSIATLDLLSTLLDKKIQAVETMSAAERLNFWTSCWRKVVEAVAEAAELSPDPSVRQHSLSMLTDIFLDKQSSLVPAQHLCTVLSELCIPLAGRCIARLQRGDGFVTSADELLIEFELCIGLIFKPLRHHLKNLLSVEANILSVWKAVLDVLEDVLCDRITKSEQSHEERHRAIPASLKSTMSNLANEHFENAVLVLISSGVLFTESKSSEDMTGSTLEAAKRMGFSESSLEEWKQKAGNATS